MRSEPPEPPDEGPLRWPVRVTMAALEIEHSAAFVVNRLKIDHLLPARLYDALVVMLNPAKRGGCHLAGVGPATRRPTRISAAMLSQMENHG